MILNIGLFFGSFNPIHIGHLIVAGIIADLKEVNQVWFVVSPQNPHKSSKSLIHEFDRYDMVEAAIVDGYNLRVSDVEFHMPRPSYTVDTLAYLADSHSDHKFKLIIGEDNLQKFPKWKNYQQILDYYGLYVYPRPMPGSHNPSPKIDQIKDHRNTTWVEAPIIDISASFVRSRIANGRSVDYLIPDAVMRMITQRKLFQQVKRS